MAGNKYDTPFAIHRPDRYRIQYQDQDGVVQSMNGTPMQVLNYILNQQKYLEKNLSNCENQHQYEEV